MWVSHGSRPWGHGAWAQGACALGATTSFGDKVVRINLRTGRVSIGQMLHKTVSTSQGCTGMLCLAVTWDAQECTGSPPFIGPNAKAMTSFDCKVVRINLRTSRVFIGQALHKTVTTSQGCLRLQNTMPQCMSCIFCDVAAKPTPGTHHCNMLFCDNGHKPS